MSKTGAEFCEQLNAFFAKPNCSAPFNDLILKTNYKYGKKK